MRRNSSTGGVPEAIVMVSPQLPSNNIIRMGLTRLDSVADCKVRMEGVDFFMSELKNSKNSSRVIFIRKIACAAIMTALAVVLMYLEIALPFMPPFLKFDFSEVPVLVASFSLGPVYGIIVEFLKNLIHLPATATAGVGELSNFITGSIYVFSAGFLYTKNRTRKGAIISMLCATALLALVAIPFNYFFTLPLYSKVFGAPVDAFVAMTNPLNSLVVSKMTLIMWGFVPFNLFKGLVVAFITFWVYKPISRLINKTYKETHKS